jgi:hypothetical protein
MTLPFALPDWLPSWAPILILVPCLLWLLAFLFMPFNVFGVKGRLDVIEARLDEIQGEVRSLALRLPEPTRAAGFDELYAPAPILRPPAPVDGPSDYGPPAAAPPRVADRPPIPPPPHDWDRPRDGRRDASPRRAEPRLDWRS